MVTKDQLAAGLEMVKAIASAIRELKQVPSGHLYAQVCGKIGLSDYQKILGILERGKLITVGTDHLIQWIAE